jgi:AMMECR1 domain-containing protein
VEREIANYRRFTEICEELVEVNEEICKLRPVEEIKDERELNLLKKSLRKKYSGKLRKR